MAKVRVKIYIQRWYLLKCNIYTYSIVYLNFKFKTIEWVMVWPNWFAKFTESWTLNWSAQFRTLTKHIERFNYWTAGFWNLHLENCQRWTLCNKCKPTLNLKINLQSSLSVEHSFRVLNFEIWPIILQSSKLKFKFTPKMWLSCVINYKCSIIMF